MPGDFVRKLMAGMTGLPFQVDGEFESRNRTTALAFSRPRGGGLDMRHRLPGHLVGLAASLRSMPTACYEDFEALIRWNGRLESIHAESLGQGKRGATVNR
jgi:hypothetical protein